MATKTVKARANKTTKKVKIKKLNVVRIFLKAQFNNSIITLTDMEGKVLAWSTSGKMGFKGSRKSTPFASQKATEDVLEKIKDTGATSAHVFVWGAGMGRDSFLRTLQASDINIESITDVTGFPHGGPRKKRPRNQ